MTTTETTTMPPDRSGNMVALADMLSYQPKGNKRSIAAIQSMKEEIMLLLWRGVFSHVHNVQELFAKV